MMARCAVSCVCEIKGLNVNNGEGVIINSKGSGRGIK